MPRFFIRQDQIYGYGWVRILGEDAHHISRSLRMAAGEHITVCDMQGFSYDCRLEQFEDGCVTAQIVNVTKADTEPPCHIHLFQALPKGDKLDTVIQKAVECGASEITPFESERCVVRIRADGEEKKQQRRERIAAEAAKQCGRAILPVVHPSIVFGEVIDAFAAFDVVLFCYEGDGTTPLGRVLSRIKEKFGKVDAVRVAVVIGSEGGFSLTEADAARRAGAHMVGLGKRILRTETASGFVLACLAYETELKEPSMI